MLSELNNLTNVVGVSTDGDNYRLDMVDGSMRHATGKEVMAATIKLKIDALKLECRNVIESGFISEALGEPMQYDSALPQDQINLLGAIITGIDIDFTCTDSNGIKKQRFHTSAQIAQVFRDGARHIEDNKALFWERSGVVMAAQSLDAIG